MEYYFLKSAACLAFLLLFYKLLLEKENMHRFKRFYLLASVVISIIIPFVTFTTYVEVPPVSPALIYEGTSVTEVQNAEKEINFLPLILWTIYGLGVLFFSFTFLKNLREIILKIKRNPKLKENHVTQVLLQEEIVPHTFWDYIFLNKTKFESNSIPAEVFQHEEAHANQKHSFDILFMELLQILFWFNPLIYFTKNAIKLNHEFLADQAVLQKGAHTANYQETLLSFSSYQRNSSLSHSINYSSIKKRFTVMKTTTSKTAIWVRTLLLLPLLAILLYSCSTKETIEKGMIFPQNNSEENNIFEFTIDKEGAIIHDGSNISYQKLQEIVARNEYTKASVLVSESAPKALLKKVVDLLLNRDFSDKFSICTMDEPGVENGNILDGLFTITSVAEEATPEMVAEYNKLAKYYNSMPEDHSVVRMKDLRRMKYIYRLMTPEQKKKAEQLPAIFPPPPPPPPVPSLDVSSVPEPPVPPAPTEFDVKTPSAPPAPPAPLEHIKELAAQGARFFVRGKGEISSKKAIEIVKDKKNIRIKVTEYNSETTVLISEGN